MRFTQKNILEFQTPIAEDLICGVYLKLDKGAFRPLRNEFNVAQTSLRKLSQNPSSQELESLQDENYENWQVLSTSLMTTFENVTRDIELIGWFITSQILLDNSLSSVAYSMNWFAELLAEQWDSINPVLPEEKLKGDSDTGRLVEQYGAKVKAFFQLLGDSEESSLLYTPLLLLPLVGHVTFYDFQSAERKGELSQLEQQATSLITFDRNGVRQRLESVADCLFQIERLITITKTYAQIAGVNAPNFNFVKTLFTKYNNALQQLSGMKAEVKVTSTSHKEKQRLINQSVNTETCGENVLLVEAVSQASDSSIPLRLTADNLSQVGLANSMNRDLAFHLLREVSSYFRQSEPHSPVSFLLEKAIRWGYLSLPELLQEMMVEQDGDNVNKIFNASGLNHSEQILLPEVGIPPCVIEKTLTFTESSSFSEPVNIEAKVAQVSINDTELKQNEDESSSRPTALRW
ncbi:type VI secretion protein [Aliivibrio salmonicida]|uniref:Type VI secretion protein VasJ-1 n=1 Tax=Aliivibrio salmonicida (strain LFI1238) TaxID=316275 RepID=B6EJJ0_ALISL|nr:type VI secretion system ImpA family N-terminal domain-containing protein [Aliivibrio salmonicida]AZL84494.1 type VI secretion protein [Aliivibrio salmonicida]CAQ78854.1 putative type VI secretion protein VasJ-1 [Aliivibrio salmonicida LFI1238]